MYNRSSKFIRRPKGFTLVELMIVIAIMAILVKIAVPRYAMAANRQQAEAAARRIAADLEEARQAARSLSATVTVVFSPTNASYDVFYPATGSAAALTRTIRLGRPPLSAQITGVSFTAPSATTVTFNGYGIASSSGTVTVKAGNFVKKVTIAADLGSVAIQ